MTARLKPINGRKYGSFCAVLIATSNNTPARTRCITASARVTMCLARGRRCARKSVSADTKSAAVLKLARAITLQRGLIADSEQQAARSAGLSDAEIIEVVAHVALNILTNYTNNLAQTTIDFPEVKPGQLEPQTCSTEGCGCSH